MKLSLVKCHSQCCTNTVQDRHYTQSLEYHLTVFALTSATTGNQRQIALNIIIIWL